MKAVYLVFCLALAQYTSARIFTRQQRYPEDIERLIIRPQEFISQYQQPQYDQNYEQPNFMDRTYDEFNEILRTKSQQKQPSVSRSKAQKTKKYHSQESMNEYSQESKNKYSQESKSSYSQESKDSISQESKQTIKINNKQKFVTPDRVSNKKQKSPRYPVVPRQEEEVLPQYGDALVWKDVQMAVSPNTPITIDDIEVIYSDAQKAMKHVTPEEKMKFHELYTVAAEKENEDVNLNATELLKKHQYSVEEHTISTDDGYFLTLFHITPKMQPTDVSERKVVFLMHGIDGSADDWLLMGPGKSLAYLLSDAGYDVWLGNARGNKYSRRHTSKHPALSDFWEFSNDEVALHDLPAMIDFVLEQSNQQKLHYVGYAQGTTTFFALAAARPEYNDKIIDMHALSPLVYMTHARSPLLKMIAPTSKFYERFRHQLGHGVFNPKVESIQTLGGAMCENEIGCKNVCSNVNFVMSGVNVEGLDINLIPVIMNHLPAGASTRMIKQYAQAVASHEFRKYDFGPVINQAVYGEPQPPKYKMEEVRAPVSLYYSEEDWLAHPEDVERLQRELPNVKEAYKVPDAHFSHMDFQFSSKAPEVVYQHLIESMEQKPISPLH